MIKTMTGGTVLRALLLFALVGGLLTVAGCGGSSDSAGTTTETEMTTGTVAEEEEEEESTPEEALAEVRAIPALLDIAVAAYAAGEQDAAADAVGDIYLEHYEHVEGPLGDVNHDLMEEIEEQISTELRTAMQDGAPQEEIDALVAEIKTGLQQAEEELS